MLKSLNQFIKLLFILILVARISVSQPKESKEATKCATKCINDMKKLAQLQQACKTMTMSKCSSHFDTRTERTPKSRRKCFRVNTHRSSTKSECVQLLQNTTSQIKSCYTFVYFCIYPDGAKFLEQEIRNAGAHSVQKRDIAMKQDSSVNLKKTPDLKTMMRLIRSARIRSNSMRSSMASNSTSSSMATTQTTTGQNFPNKQNTTPISTPSADPTNFLDDWAHRLLVAAGALLVLLGSLFTVALFKYRKRRTSGSNANYTVELRPVSPTLTLGQNGVQNSHVYCETDTFQFTSKEQHPETTENEIVETEVDRSTADVEGNSEDEYCYPENIEDEYENMNPVNPPQASGEYACAYDHVNINTGYMNEDDYEVPHDYEYPQNTGDWRDPGFKEATLSSSEPVTPLDKDNVDDNFYENYQILLRENLEKENETDT